MQFLSRRARARLLSCTLSWVVLVGSAGLARASLGAQLFTHPFENRVYRWDGVRLRNALVTDDPGVSPTLDGEAIASSAPPLGYLPGHALFASERGQLIDVDLATGQTSLLYQAKDRCSSALGFSGCIYSMTVASAGRALFIEHQRNGNDSVLELSAGAVRKLVTDVPGPSGPIWIRPNGHLGLLPYGTGIIDLPIPTGATQGFAQSGATTENWVSMGAFAAEGQLASGENVLLLHDFSAVVRRSAGQTSQLIETTAAAFDPCTGTVWIETPTEGETSDPGTEVIPFANSTLGDLPVNPAACPVATNWTILNREGSTAYADRTDVIQGLPSGNENQPSQHVLPLGVLGSITLRAAQPILDGAGPDLVVFENAFVDWVSQTTFTEPARVEVANGGEWKSTGCDCANPQPNVCAGMQPTFTQAGNGIVPWDSARAGGFAIDLAALGLGAATTVRITDCGKSAETPGGNPGFRAGFDLDAIVSTHLN